MRVKFILFVVLLLSCLLFSISFASFSITNASWKNIDSTFTSLEGLKKSSIDYLGYDLTDINSFYVAQSQYQSGASDFITKISNLNDYSNVLIRFYKKNTSNNYWLVCRLIWSNSSSFTERLYYYDISYSSSWGKPYCTTSNYHTYTSLSVEVNVNTNDYLMALNHLNNQWRIPSNSDYSLIDPLTFEPLYNDTKLIGNITFNVQNFTRYVTNFKIGELQAFNVNEDYHGIVFMLVDGNLQTTDVTCFINATGEVFVYTTNLLFEQGYVFRFYNGDRDTGFIHYYFIPLGSSFIDISGDSYVYDGFDNNDIIPIQNAINSQYDVNSGDLYGIIDNDLFPSGDLSLITDTYNFDGYTNSYFDLLYNFYRNILTTLTGTGNVQLPIIYRDFSMTLNSNDFYVPNSPIKTLITTILIVWCVFLIYQDLDKQFRHIRQFEVGRFLHDTDVDYHMFL